MWPIQTVRLSDGNRGLEYLAPKAASAAQMIRTEPGGAAFRKTLFNNPSKKKWPTCFELIGREN